MRCDGYDLKQLTDESKDVWDYINNNSRPIEKYTLDVRHCIEIRPDYMFDVLKKAIDDGIISTKTRRWRDLYVFRNFFPIYLCEVWLVRILYRMDIPIYYSCGKGIDNSDWYRFYAKITYRSGWNHREELYMFISDEIDKYIKRNQNNRGGVK